MKKKKNVNWPLFRVIIPAFFEVNIYTGIASKTTSLGPTMVATVADKLWDWRVEVIDENNSRKIERDNKGFIDHVKLQKERPATVVGFYCGLSSTMERVWKLAEFYKSQGVFIIAGGWHTDYLPEESLRRGMDVIVHGDAELIIRKLLERIKRKSSFNKLPGISFMKQGKVVTNSFGSDSHRLRIDNLDNLPFPNFGLIRNAKIKFYPIGRIRGCSRNCEFCSVRGKPRWASSQYLFEMVDYLVETRRASKFFIVDDRLEEDRRGSLEFFTKIAEKYGRSLDFTVQVRLETAKDIEFLTAMKKAGVKEVCIGYESPIDEELKAMRKGYLSSDMLKWTKIFRGFDFLIHQMYIFGYPSDKVFISAKERFRRFKKFIRRAFPDTFQILRIVPLIGSDLRSRLEREGKLFSLESVPWSRYDGNYACFMPDDMSLKELQEMPTKLMKWFYHPISFVRIPLRTLAFPFDYLVRGWPVWYRGWRNDIKRYGGHLIINQWIKRYKSQDFLGRLLKDLEKKSKSLSSKLNVKD